MDREFFKDLVIRKAEPKDLDVILEIMNEAQKFLADRRMFFTDTREFVEETISGCGFGLIAMKNGVAVAYMVVRYPGLEADNLGRYLSLTKEQLMKVALLDSVAVRAEFRGHGLQKALIEEAEKRIREAGFVHFMAKTHPDNRASLKSFISRGYEPMLTVHEHGSVRTILYKSIYGDERKEYFALFDKNGEELPRIKERKAVHRDGDLHGGAHIWIMEKYINPSGEESIRVLLQKRSADKDSFPNCYDCSCAGHVDAGESFISTALRELKEELGLEADEEELEFLFKQMVGGEYEFYETEFKNYELNYVYLLKKPVNIDCLTFQKEEIQGLEWEDAYDVLARLSDSEEPERTGYCIWIEEYRKVLELIFTEGEVYE